MMFQRLLIPLDESELAEQALAVAASIARHCEGRIVLLECVVPPIELGPYIGEPPILVKQAIEIDTQMAASYLKQVTQTKTLAGLVTEAKIEYGWPAQRILAYVEQQQCDLIVISSHGRSGLSRWILGSVAQKVIRHATIPVLVLRDPHKSEALLDSTRSLHALIPLDGSSASETVLLPAIEMLSLFATQKQGTLHLVHVISEASGGHERLAFVQQQADVYLNTIEHHLQDRIAKAGNLTVSKSIIMASDITSALLQEAEGSRDSKGNEPTHPYDLIMMSTHGQGGLQRWALGSVAERVLHGTKLPLLMVRAHE
ncbi:universal stress protein UspA [Reticulibacter mediterranei]|uniref:Universal stress protein UspA n=1 Tax=Reticulibacter mediterranei TaxID=2778369 RepID=A0A8J3N8Z3_9CHLR|nr:universal stress protein [Reticulibacter mediterranei]GHO98747.1 universal stress protein UspA [Reticulibacter mediterranei]